MSWYVTFATSPLVIGYNPHSKFADDLKTKPWYEVITEPGFLIGRTDPKTDPKGKLTDMALAQAAKMYNLPALTAISSATDNVYPEETLVGRLQAGQLDAGFFYTSETTRGGYPHRGADRRRPEGHLHRDRAQPGAPPGRGGGVRLLPARSAGAQAILTKSGFHLVQPPTVTGTGVPASVSSAATG